MEPLTSLYSNSTVSSAVTSYTSRVDTDQPSLRFVTVDLVAPSTKVYS